MMMTTATMEQAEGSAVRCAASPTVCSYLYTHRATSSDVISIVTTAQQSKGAQMADLAVGDSLRASKSTADKFSWGTPLAKTTDEHRSRMHHLLRAERDEFMDRLHDNRMRRMAQESYAATHIQRQFRGYRVRANRTAILQRCEVRKRVRTELRKKLGGNEVVLSAKQYSERRRNERALAALRIQASFRRFNAQNTVQRLRPLREQTKLLAAITTIQSFFRLWTSQRITTISALEATIESRQSAAAVIQCAVRRHQAIIRVARRRRRLRYTAALVIQCAYRTTVAKRRTSKKWTTRSTRRRYVGATKLQKLVRGFLARQRCYLLRRDKLVNSCILIQAHIRKHLASRQVTMQRQTTLSRKIEKSATIIQRHARGMMARRRAYDAQLLQQCDALACASRGDLAGLQDTRELVDDISAETNSDGDNVLIVGARQGHLAIVRQCLEWDIDIDFMNGWGEAAIVAAVKAQQGEVASYLLAKGCNIDGEAESLLYEAAAGGLVEVLQTLIGAGHDVDMVCNEYEETPIFAACQQGMLNSAEILIECGANVHKRNADGQTVLHKAAAGVNQSIQLLQLLIDNGLDPSSGAEIPGLPRSHAQTGRTPWLNATLAGHTQTLEHFKSVAPLPTGAGKIIWSDEDVDAAAILCEADQLELVQQLIMWGLNCNATSSRSQDSLILAAARGSAQRVVAELCRQNVLLDAVNKQGRTVLHEACASLNPEITTELVIRMHNLNARFIGQEDAMGITPLHEAAASGVSVDLIDRQGVEAAVNKRTAHGLTPLMVSCLYKHFQVALSLLSCGADAQALDSRGRSALHYCYASQPKERCQVYSSSNHLRLEFPTSGVPAARDAGSSSPMHSFISARRSVIIQLIASKCSLVDGKQPVIRLMKQSGDEHILLEMIESIDTSNAWDLLLLAIRYDYDKLVGDALQNSLLSKRLAQVSAGTITDGAGILQMIDDFASLEAIAYNGKTIAGWTVECQSLNSLRRLLELKWNINGPTDSLGNSLLHLASGCGETAIIDMLMRVKGINLENCNKASMTPLAVAVENKQEAAARQLVRYGANIASGLQVRMEAWMLARDKLSQPSTVQRYSESVYLLWYLHPKALPK